MLVYTAATQHGPSNECYIESQRLVFQLHKTVEWGSDRELGMYRTLEEALEDAKKLGCATVN